MQVTLNWLKDYVEINTTPEDLAQRITMSGTCVETLEEVAPKVQGLVVGVIEKIEKHPDADKLSVCSVNVGKQTPITIITSATNVFEGAKVPVAVIGATVANGDMMGEAAFRGITSEGMFCSVEEMGLDTSLFSKEHLEGIYIFEEDLKPGTDVKSYMWGNDHIIEVEITANRSDCQSIYGIAKEVSATLNTAVHPPKLYPLGDVQGDIHNYLSVEIDSNKCSRYHAQMFRVKKVEPSPHWMQVRLLNAGVRPINNIVDVTNFVMLEMGQPLHAFDYESLKSKKIVVREAGKDRTVTTLDDKERTLEPDMLMITNGTYPVAVAGIMGGANSEITKETKLVLLESACFDKTSVRLTSQRLGLRSESSTRFEKGLYPNLVEKASARATELLLSIGACERIDGYIDVYPHKQQPRSIDVSVQWVNDFIGINISKEEMSGYLKRLFLDVQTDSKDPDKLTVYPPDYRQDLEIREDIAEEVARLYGYNNIPNTIMGGTTLVGGKTRNQQLEELLVHLLIGSGYNETLTTSFTNLPRMIDLKLEKEGDKVVELLNPLGEDNRMMRNTLMAHQLDVIQTNYNHKNTRGRFFEIAMTYHHNENVADLPIEKEKCVISAYDDIDFFELKGLVERIFITLGIDGVEYKPGETGLFHPYRNADIYIKDACVGQLGEVHPAVVTKNRLPRRTYLCELDCETLYNAAQLDVRYEELPRFPGSVRDIALVLDEEVPAGDVVKVIESQNNGIIESIQLFDVYVGDQIEKGKKSLAYSIHFRLPDRTLTDEDIQGVMDAILNDLNEKLHAKLRD